MILLSAAVVHHSIERSTAQSRPKLDQEEMSESMTDMVYRLPFLGVLFLVLSPATAQALQEQSPGPDDICSLFDVMVANGRALTRGDVLIRERHDFDSFHRAPDGAPRGVVVEEKALISCGI